MSSIATHSQSVSSNVQSVSVYMIYYSMRVQDASRYPPCTLYVLSLSFYCEVANKWKQETRHCIFSLAIHNLSLSEAITAVTLAAVVNSEVDVLYDVDSLLSKCILSLNNLLRPNPCGPRQQNRTHASISVTCQP